MSKNVVRWNWNFGDGTDSTVQSPMHTYPAARVYTVNLTVNNGNGTNTKLATITVPSIYGYSFNDLNGNKIMDVVDVGISNMAINLNGYDTSTSRETIISTTTRTDATGYYEFKSVNPGVYTVLQGFAIGWLPTTDASYTMTVSSNYPGIKKDFGNSIRRYEKK